MAKTYRVQAATQDFDSAGFKTYIENEGAQVLSSNENIIPPEFTINQASDDLKQKLEQKYRAGVIITDLPNVEL